MHVCLTAWWAPPESNFLTYADTLQAKGVLAGACTVKGWVRLALHAWEALVYYSHAKARAQSKLLCSRLHQGRHQLIRGTRRQLLSSEAACG